MRDSSEAQGIGRHVERAVVMSEDAARCPNLSVRAVALSSSVSDCSSLLLLALLARNLLDMDG